MSSALLTARTSLSNVPFTFIAAPPRSDENGAAAPASFGANSRATTDDLRRAVFAGLERPPKQRTLPCRFLYDVAGSELFEKICDLPEYYPTRTERALFNRHANDIIAATMANRTRARGGAIALVEFGSGSSAKTRLLMDALLSRQARLHYTPIDISADFLRESAQTLLTDYDGRLRITAVAGEYEAALSCLPTGGSGDNNNGGDDARLFLFLGGNIGNFTPAEATAFLARVCAQMGRADTLLVGAALQTGTVRMEAAYNDIAGVTARFNKNLLTRLNREVGSDFDLEKWNHHAPYVAEEGRIEMRLVSACDQTITFTGRGYEERSFDFEAGEYIHTENSHKYTPDGLAAIWTRAGFGMTAQWTDAEKLFSVSLLAPLAG